MFIPASGSSTWRSASRTASSSGMEVMGIGDVRELGRHEIPGAFSAIARIDASKHRSERAGRRLVEPPHERQTLRWSESDAVEEAEQREVMRGHHGLHALDTQRAEIDEQLRQQRVCDTAVRETGIGPDGVDDGHGFGA